MLIIYPSAAYPVGKEYIGITIVLFVPRDHFIVPKYKPRQIVLMMANMRKFQFT